MRRFAIILIMLLASVVHADWLGTFDIDDYLPIHCTTSQFTTGALLTTANAQYRIYEGTTGTFSTTEVVGPTALTMNFDGMTGLHVGSVQLSAANTFEAGKCYVLFVQATVDSVVAGISHGFRIRAGSLATEAKQDIIDTNVDDIKGYTDDIGIAGAGLTAIDLPNQTMDITGNLSGSVGSLTGHTVQTGDTYGLASNLTYGLSALYDIITHATYGLSALRTQGDAAWITAVSGLEVDITKVHGTAITETTGGRIAGNLSTFWDNADAVTTKTVDDIGGTATIPPRLE